ncbi:hypothetical protein [Streptomyces virginiae]|uniref:hypothetical protein n=1 Tax=Streptomyces virginiae TaxID=1961 RepID=UPI0022568F9A|nr:hypothetical protein [Streptomyces virginiae]MCX4962979.1 hypothetical protein [Streptomyces virginiae]
MADNYTAALIMAKMRGLPRKAEEQAAEDRIKAKVESYPTTAEIQRRLRGSADYSEIHKANAEAQRKHDSAVRQRTAQLQSQGMKHHYAEATAIRQLQAERQSADEASRRAQTDHEMVERASAHGRAKEYSRRAENAGQRGRTVNDHGVEGDRTSNLLMAQYYRNVMGDTSADGDE